MIGAGSGGGGASGAGAGNGGTRFRRRVLLVAIVAAAVVGPLAWLGASRLWEWCLTSPRFAIAEVRVEGTRRLPASAVEAEAGLLRGTNLFRLDPRAVERRLASHPWIASARVLRRPPRAVRIVVVEREPVALLPVGEWHALDPEGRLMPVSAVPERLELPLVAGCFGPDGLDAGRLREAARFLVTVAATCDFLLRDVSEVNVKDPEDVTVTTLRSGTEIRMGRGGYEEKLERLLLVLEDLSGREQAPASIDLRYRGQAIVRFHGAAGGGET